MVTKQKTKTDKESLQSPAQKIIVFRSFITDNWIVTFYKFTRICIPSAPHTPEDYCSLTHLFLTADRLN